VLIGIAAVFVTGDLSFLHRFQNAQFVFCTAPVSTSLYLAARFLRCFLRYVIIVTMAKIAPGRPMAIPMIASVVRPFFSSAAGAAGLVEVPENY
jgi:hypothetical protein